MVFVSSSVKFMEDAGLFLQKDWPFNKLAGEVIKTIQITVALLPFRSAVPLYLAAFELQEFESVDHLEVGEVVQ